MKPFRIELKRDLRKGHLPQLENTASYGNSEWRDILAMFCRVGMVRQSKAEVASQAYLAEASDDSLEPRHWTDRRTVRVDWRAINLAKRTPVAEEKTPLRLQDEPRFLSRIDLRRGYLRMRIHEDDRKHTAFETPCGRYEWLVVPYGIAGVADAFREALQEFFAAHGIRKGVWVTRDEIFVVGETAEPHNDVLEKVMRLLTEAGLEPDSNGTTLCDTSVLDVWRKRLYSDVAPLQYDKWHHTLDEAQRDKIFPAYLCSSKSAQGTIGLLESSIAERFKPPERHGIDLKNRAWPSSITPLRALQSAQIRALRSPILFVKFTSDGATYTLVHRERSQPYQVAYSGCLRAKVYASTTLDEYASLLVIVLEYLRPALDGQPLEIITSESSLRWFMLASCSHRVCNGANALAEHGAFLR